MNEKSIKELLNFCIINVDKPSEITSFVCSDRIRRILEAKKAGHFGTLDPMVTGVLPIAVNRATRLANYFMKKEYIGKMKIHKDIPEEELKKEIKNFIGKIKQIPPRKSRVKREERERTVNKWEILEINGKIASFRCDVEAGTYIRKLVSDLGEKIGGAHMIELRRIRAGIFLEKDSYLINEIEKAFKEAKEGNEKNLRKILIPAEDLIKKSFLCITVNEDSIRALLNGKPLMNEDLKDNLDLKENLFAVFDKDMKKFIGIYKKINQKNIIGLPEFILN